MNPAVYETMWGPSEHLGVGPLTAFDLTDRLAEVDVPVLVTSGEHELVTPDAARAVAEGLPHGEWELFHGCAHCAVYEDPERYGAVLRRFLLRVDRGERSSDAPRSRRRAQARAGGRLGLPGPQEEPARHPTGTTSLPVGAQRVNR